MLEDSLEPIAIVGMASRLSQDADSTEGLWKLLVDGKSTRSKVPPERFNLSSHNYLKAHSGHFFREDIAAFDAQFFSMTPEDAAAVDPMQRFLLEVTYEALENAGMSLIDIAGSNTSVYVGCYSRDYEMLINRDPQLRDRHRAFGTALSMISNRISWFFDLKGPSLTLDTACSGSLYAIHLACSALRLGDATMAIAGGASMNFNPDSTAALDDFGLLSPEGKCYSFDERANGYSRGEGVGIVVLKPLTTALRDGDTIRALIRSSAVNQDGKTAVLSQPSSEAQEALIRRAYEAGGLDMSHTRYFEAHGTGTRVGDPIEAHAISSAFRDYITPSRPMIVGTVKSSIGHLEAASGVAGLIKSVLAIERGVIPPNAGFETPNPKVLDSSWSLMFPTKAMNWPTNGMRRCSVSGFGFSGSNAHVVLDDAHHYLAERGLRGNHRTQFQQIHNSQELPSVTVGAVEGTSSESRLQLFLLSAADKQGLQRLYRRYAGYLFDRKLSPHPRLLNDLAHTLSAKRSRLPWKSFVMATSLDELQSSFEKDIPTPVHSQQIPVLAYVFTGQGAQWPTMGLDLQQFPVFRKSLSVADIYFRSLGSSWSLTDELAKDVSCSRLNNPEISQPACTAVQIALVELLRDWSIYPAAVIGHSSGEIAAAYSTGALSMTSALKVAYYRGIVAKFVRDAAAAQAMVATGLSVKEAQSLIDSSGVEASSLAIACVNSPNSVTISGSVSSVSEVERIIQSANGFYRRLPVDVAYHSPYMAMGVDFYETLIGDLECDEVNSALSAQRSTAMYSTVTGKVISESALQTRRYWSNNLISPVNFVGALENLDLQETVLPRDVHYSQSRMRVERFIEIGPHSALRGPLRETFGETDRKSTIAYNSMLVRGESCVKTSLEAAGALYCAGWPVCVDRINNPANQRKNLELKMLVDLPSYPFNHSKKYWLESRLSKNFRFQSLPNHELLGAQVPDWNELEPRWRNYISVKSHPWLSDHRINGIVVYPSAAMLISVVEAITLLSTEPQAIATYEFKNVRMDNALLFYSDVESVEVELALNRPSGTSEQSSGFLSWSTFHLYAFEDGKSRIICSGSAAAKFQHSGDDHPCQDSLEKPTANSSFVAGLVERAELGFDERISTQQFYDAIRNGGIEYGSTFALLTDIQHSRTESIAKLDRDRWTTRSSTATSRYAALHPTSLDAILHSTFALQLEKGKEKVARGVPTLFERLSIAPSPSVSTERHVSRSSDPSVVYTHLDSQTDRLQVFTISACSKLSNRPILHGILQVTRLDDEAKRYSETEPFAYEIEWKPALQQMSTYKLGQYCSAKAKQTHTGKRITQSPPEEDQIMYCYCCIWHIYELLQNGHLKLGKGATSLKYVAWVKHTLAKLDRDPQFRLKVQSIASDRSRMHELQHQLEIGDATAQVLAKVGSNLCDLLSGKQDALELLFSGDLMTQYYQSKSYTNDIMAQVRAYMDLESNQNASLRILEVGAGTGSATREIMPILIGETRAAPCFEEYVFTDVSTSFFEKAREEFTTKEMRFCALDITKPPRTQGFQEASFDIVVCANVLHATPDLSLSIQHAASLLKDGGRLLLYEEVDPDYLPTGFIFGHLDGFWLSSEADRELSPLIPTDRWHEYLLGNGFQGVELVMRDSGDAHVQSYVPIAAMLAIRCTGNVSGPASGDLTEVGTGIIGWEESALVHTLAPILETTGPSDFVPFAKIISNETTPQRVILLPDICNSLLYSLDKNDFARLQFLVQNSSVLLLVSESTLQCTDNPVNAMLDGLIRVLVNESTKAARLAILKLDPSESVAEKSGHIHRVFQAICNTDGESPDLEWAVEQGILHIPRLKVSPSLTNLLSQDHRKAAPIPTPFNADNSRALQLSIGTRTDLGTLFFKDDLARSDVLEPDEIEIKVHYAGVNFKDVVSLFSDLGVTSSFGIECSGTISRTANGSRWKIGERVCAMGLQCFGTYARTNSTLVARVPETVGLPDAAGLPIVFATAHYSLHEVARLQPGETILIHSGAGGLGQAVIQLACMQQAKVFVTAGTKEKRDYLHRQYAIPRECIFSSRNADFAEKINTLTNGRGVDVVVNSLQGEGLRLSWDLVAPLGRFVELSLKDALERLDLPMDPFSRGASFTSVDLLQVASTRPALIQSILNECMSLLETGKITIPSPLQTYSVSQIEDALRYLQGGRNMGKTIIKFEPNAMVQATPVGEKKYELRTDVSYIIVGGFGGLGRSIVQWMINKGAANLIILSRSGEEANLDFVKSLRDQGVKIHAPPCDVSDADSLARVLAQCHAHGMPAICGCIQGAMVLKDSSFNGMTSAQFSAVTRPKVQGSWNLHRLLPLGLDFFIMLSSFCGTIGHHGQANYASANTYQDGLASHLRKTGQRPNAVAFDLGVMDSIGYVSEKGLTQHLQNQGLAVLSEQNLHNLLEHYCHPSRRLDPGPAQVITGLVPPSALRAAGNDIPTALYNPRFSHLFLISTSDGDISSSQAIVPQTDYQSLLSSAADSQTRAAIICNALRSKMAKVLAILPEEVNVAKPLSASGIDSLSAIELRGWITRALGLDVSVLEILGSKSIIRLANDKAGNMEEGRYDVT